MGCLTVRKEVKQRRARLINQQDHIAFLECKGCPKRRAYDPIKKCGRCKTYRKLGSIGKELEQISRLRRWRK
ncbi:hypothetical protein B1B04_08385 [Lysinibacillus sp. KCTC 33748]|nr:hypothetical protein B1B04_08385 [Lysinibacillus sp. KCTC 33748]